MEPLHAVAARAARAGSRSCARLHARVINVCAGKLPSARIYLVLLLENPLRAQSADQTVHGKSLGL